MNHSQSPFAQFSLDKRARVPLQWLSQTVAMTAAWVVAWYWAAPALGIRVLSPIEVVETIVSTLAPTILLETGVSSALSMGELIFGLAIWTLPIFAGLCGIATVGSALWYAVGRWVWPSAAGETGGDST